MELEECKKSIISLINNTDNRQLLIIILRLLNKNL